MLRKNINFLYGGGIGILLIAAVIIFNQYQNSRTQEPVNLYKDTEPSQQVHGIEKQSISPEVTTQPETVDIEEVRDSEVAESAEDSEELSPEPDKPNEPSEENPIKAAESQQEDPQITLLKEVFPEFDRLLHEGQQLVEDMQGRAGEENYAEKIEARGRALEAEMYDNAQRITEIFPGAVTFMLLEGEEWTYDVDFQMLKDSIKGPIPSELEPYFRFANMREMFGLPEIPPDFPLIDQIEFITR